MSKEYYLGVVVGIICAILLIWLLCRAFKIRRVNPQYDERQLAARGKSYRLGFFTLLIWCAFCGMLDSFGVRWCENIGIALYLGIIVSAGVFAVSAVCSDAYFGYNESFGSARLLALLGILNLVMGVLELVSGVKIIENGLLQSSPTLNLAIALLFGVLLVVNRIHGKKTAAQEDEAE